MQAFSPDGHPDNFKVQVPATCHVDADVPSFRNPRDVLTMHEYSPLYPGVVAPGHTVGLVSLGCRLISVVSL
jgi:hypothetical protein